MTAGSVALHFVHEVFLRYIPIAVINNIIFYGIFLLTNTNTLLDFGWYLNQFLIALYAFSFSGEQITAKYWLLLSLVFLWAVLFGGYILLTRVMHGVNDRRYEEIQQESMLKNRKVFFFFQFIGQGFLMASCCCTVFFMFRHHHTMGWYVYVGAAIALFGTIMQFVADMQLYNFVKTMKQSPEDEKAGLVHPVKQTYRGGLWTKSRHPNLFFDIVVWVGFAIAGLNDPISWLGFLGPINLWAIMQFVSIPLTEKSMKKKRPDWEEYVKSTNTFWPL